MCLQLSLCSRRYIYGNLSRIASSPYMQSSTWWIAHTASTTGANYQLHGQGCLASSNSNLAYKCSWAPRQYSLTWHLSIRSAWSLFKQIPITSSGTTWLSNPPASYELRDFSVNICMQSPGSDSMTPSTRPLRRVSLYWVANLSTAKPALICCSYAPLNVEPLAACRNASRERVGSLKGCCQKEMYVVYFAD